MGLETPAVRPCRVTNCGAARYDSLRLGTARYVLEITCLRKNIFMLIENLYSKANVALLYYETTKSEVRHTHMHLKAIPICECYSKLK
jgi:hypothetical protein